MFIRFFLILQLLFLSLSVFANGPDTSNWAPGPSPEWHLTLESAQKAAKQKGRKICVLLTGSDWCGWCIRLKRNVLDKEEFKAFAGKNLELVYIDRPRRKPMPAAQKQYNSALYSRLGGGGYPTTYVLDASGKVLGRVGGGGWDVAGYIKKLQDPSPAGASRSAAGRRTAGKLAPTGPSLPPPGWHTSLETAISKAKPAGKKVLVLKTGSDWCPPCKRLERDVLSSAEFKAYAKNNLELVFLDIPRRKTISPEQKRYNARTSSALKMGRGVPSIALVNTDGTVIARLRGYRSLNRFMDFLKNNISRTAPAPDFSPVSRSLRPQLDPARAAELLIQSKFSFGGWGESAAAATNKGLPGPQMAGKTCFFRVNYDLAGELYGKISLRGNDLQAFPSNTVRGKGSVVIKGVFRSGGISSTLQITFQCVGRGRFNSIHRITPGTSAR